MHPELILRCGSSQHAPGVARGRKRQGCPAKAAGKAQVGPRAAKALIRCSTEAKSDQSLQNVKWANELKLHEAGMITEYGVDGVGCQACGLTVPRTSKFKLMRKYVCVGMPVFKDVDAAKRRRLLYHIGSAWPDPPCYNWLGISNRIYPYPIVITTFMAHP